MTGYTRQSITEIAADEEIKAEPLNSEFNALATAFNAANGHAHDGTSGSGPKINLSSSVIGTLPISHIAVNSITKDKLVQSPARTVLGNMTGTTANVDNVSVLDEDNLISNSDTALPTQQSVKAYVDALDTAVVGALDDLVNYVDSEIVTVTNYIDSAISDVQSDISDLETAISNIKIRDLLYQNSSFTLSSSTNLSFTGILDKYRAFEIEANITSLNNNTGGTVGLLLSVGDGTDWYEIGASTQSFLVNWVNNSVGNRSFRAEVNCIDDLNLPVVMSSFNNSLTPPTLSVGMSTPGSLSVRPVSALRFRVVPTSGTVIASFNKLRIWGLLK